MHNGITTRRKGFGPQFLARLSWLNNIDSKCGGGSQLSTLAIRAEIQLRLISILARRGSLAQAWWMVPSQTLAGLTSGQHDSDK